MLCSVNLSELGPEDVHCDLCVQIYSILLHISSFLSTASFLFTAHIVFTKSTPFMAIYRLYLLNCLCWGYLYSLLNSQIQFVILAPVIANYMKGQILPSIFRAIGLENYLLALTEVCFNNYIVGLLLLLLYRFVYFGPNSQSSTLGRALRSPMTLLAIMSASTILGGLIDAIGLHLLTNDEDPRRLANRFPQLKSIFELHNAIGLSGLEDFKYLALLSSLTAASFLLGLILTNLGLHLKRCRNVRKLSSGNNSQTLRLMTQLYRMNTVQIILIGLLLTGPFLIGAGITAYKCRFSHNFWLLAIWLSSLHCSFDSMVILLYIRPYREYLHSTFIDSRWWRKNSVSTTTFVSQQQQMVPMTSLQMFSAGGMACSRINGGNGAEVEMPRVVCFSVESARRNTAPDQKN